MNWPLLENLPAGWRIDKTAGSPVHGYVFATDGRSVINGQKRALVRAEIPIQQSDVPIKKTEPPHTPTAEKSAPDAFPAKTFNDLARKRFELRMLADIRFDLAVCEIEGWPKDEYLKELKTLIENLTP